MDVSSIISIIISIIIGLVVLVVSLVVTLVSLVVPIVIVWMVVKRLQSGQGVVVVSGPLAGAFAASQPKQAGPSFVKRSTCGACGGPKVQRSLSAYAYCDFCGALMDWDFQAALADKRSRLPGPTYEALLARLGPALEQARISGDRDAYEKVQVEIFDAYVSACPAAVPPRVGDPEYRERFVAWSARAQTAQDLDPTTAATAKAQSATVSGLVWDRSNPFQPRIQVASFDTLLDAVMAHQDACVDLLVRESMLEDHPDRPDADLVRRMGMSVLVQGWIPYLPPDAVDGVLEKTGLKGDYDRVEPPDLRSGACPHCSAPLGAVAGAKRVLCLACGHMVGAGGGSVSCHACAAPVELPSGTNLFECPHCNTELRMMRWGA